MDTRHININDYDYDLPADRIAKFPLAQRDQSKLLVYRNGEITEDVFFHLPQYLPQGALMVFNNTRVIQARMHFRKPTGALIEVFLLEPMMPSDYELMFQTTDSCKWKCIIGNLKKWKDGRLERRFDLRGKELVLTAEKTNEENVIRSEYHEILFTWNNPEVSFSEILEIVGELPIPPYLNRETQESDKTTYQTVYSKIQGSVAAPTAGLHFTNRVLDEIDACGVEREELTLHVGAGTFKPVKSKLIEGHTMHTEFVSVRRGTIENLIRHQARAIAVGTTSVRTLESLYYMGCRLADCPDATESELHISQWEPYQNQYTLTPVEALQNILDWLERNHQEALQSSTQIMIAPGYDYKIVRMLVTNFHQPKSTLLLLVSAFVKGDWRRIYDYALHHDFRFLSYGDSSLIIP